jgi:hypothetical protein
MEDVAVNTENDRHPNAELDGALVEYRAAESDHTAAIDGLAAANMLMQQAADRFGRAAQGVAAAIDHLVSANIRKQQAADRFGRAAQRVAALLRNIDPTLAEPEGEGS